MTCDYDAEHVRAKVSGREEGVAGLRIHATNKIKEGVEKQQTPANRGCCSF